MYEYGKENAELGARIQEIRLKRNLTQEELAERAGICNAQQMSKIERGMVGLSLARFKDICKVLDIEADYLLFGISITNAETVLNKYVKQMEQEQLNALIDLVKVYAKSCGIKEL
jgi:transcriptional regulator with XRE-family HTH domain